MEPKELRIGNWVDGGNNGNLYYKIKPYDFINTDFDKTKPIPLTHEILEKCGLLEGNVFPEINYFSIQDGSLLFEGRYMAVDNIKYLHELQNLYYALTGEELPINLI